MSDRSVASYSFTGDRSVCGVEVGRTRAWAVEIVTRWDPERKVLGEGEKQNIAEQGETRKKEG
jgi:hypothetical protein